MTGLGEAAKRDPSSALERLEELQVTCLDTS